MDPRKRPSRKRTRRARIGSSISSELESQSRQRGPSGPRGPTEQGPANPKGPARKGPARQKGPARGKGPARSQNSQGWRRSSRLQTRTGMQAQAMVEAGSSNSLSKLESLPHELLLSIIRFMRPPDMVCLSLCSHALFNVIDTGWMKGNKMLNVAALTQLAGDLPNQYCCHYCVKLHNTRLIFPPGSWLASGNWCKGSLALGFHEDTLEPLAHLFEAHWAPSNYHFRHNHLLIAMKNYYRGRTDEVTVKSLCFTEVLKWKHDPSITTLLSVDAYPCILGKDRRTLVLQIQQWVVFRGGRESAIQLGITADIGRLAICAHKFLGSNDVRRYMLNNLYYRGWRKDHLPSGLRCCPVCWIDFTIELRNCGINGKAIVVTKWVDLGAGLELDDQKWNLLTNRHIKATLATHILRSPGRARKIIDYTDPSIGKPCLLSTLTAYNQSFLDGDRYLSYMNRCPNGFFTWKGEYRARNPKDLILRVLP